MTLYWGGQLDKFVGKKIFNVDEIKNLDFDRIIIANKYYVTLEQVLNLGIPEEKIAIYDPYVLDDYLQKKQNIKPIQFCGNLIITSGMQDFKTIDENLIKSGNDVMFYTHDYVRTGTLFLLAKEIHDRKIPGDVAEFGVDQGDSAKYINEVFPDRTLHLFDSFENQSAEEFAEYNLEKFNPKVFAKTSVDLVMSKMKFPEKIEIHKGFFPDTIPTEEKIFAFVSIDVGPYKPTWAALKYFYPRLSVGGYIMLRCYNYASYIEEMSQVINDFEKEFGKISKVPIPDLAGTLVITK